MPKLVIEHPVTKQVQTYLIVCDSDIPSLLGEDIDTIALSPSLVKKAAKSAQHLPLGEMISYQSLIDQVSELQSKDICDELTKYLWFFRNLSFWKRCKYLFTGYSQLLLFLEQDNKSK